MKELFIKGNDAEILENGMTNLISELEKLKKELFRETENIGDSSSLTHTENQDIEFVLTDLKSKLNDEIIESFNVETFLRKIYQMMDLSTKDKKESVSNEFNDYYNSLKKRIETLVGEESKSSYDDYQEAWEGEKSVLTRKQFEREKFELQIELLKLQEWVKNNKKKIAIVFEGRDTSGKGSTIKRFVEYLDPKGFKVVALSVPSEQEKKNWFSRYKKHMPKEGEIVFFDRSWHNRSVVEPAMGYCTAEQYKKFMQKVNSWEQSLIDSGIILIKFWFSITREKQIQRFELRKKSPLKYWKFSCNDSKVISKWDLITYYKKQMFQQNSIPENPWIIINTNDKRVGRLNAIRYVLSIIDYEGKDNRVCTYYPEVVHIVKK
jgi:polyphosphate kinase 2